MQRKQTKQPRFKSLLNERIKFKKVASLQLFCNIESQWDTVTKEIHCQVK